jgi:N-acetylglucosaminyldiphosphoundecaprenol N-acetyl-beta-D-mannosaminyltransferase
MLTDVLDEDVEEVAGPAARVDFDRNVHCVLGVPFDAIDMDDALRRIERAVVQRTPCFLSTPNLNFLVGSDRDAALRHSIIDSDLSVVDGMPVLWLAKLLGMPFRERVAGSDMFEHLRRRTGRPMTVYFFGGEEGVAAAAARRINASPSGLLCVGYQSPGFGTVDELSSEAILARINDSRADFLVVALGAKKGQAWIERNRARLEVPVVAHLGAVINFTAGTVIRAPRWMQRSGLEWLWRTMREDGLWRRYLSDGVAFARLLATRVIPLYVLLRLGRPSASGREPRVEREDHGERVTLRLRGAWAGGNLAEVRRLFAQVASSRKALQLDLGDVAGIDTSFLGLLLLLEGARRRQDLPFSCEPVSPQVRRILKYACPQILEQQPR